LDRFDIYLEIVKTPVKNIFVDSSPENEILKINSIQNAREIQNERFAHQKNINKNADMTLSEIKKFCELSNSDKDFLNHAAENLKLSNRGYFKTIKLARTIADLENQEHITILQKPYNTENQTKISTVCCGRCSNTSLR
jgi:magnesium chelatase family protein